MDERQRCCLIHDGIRCRELSTSFPLSEKSERMFRQRGLQIRLDEKAAHIYICEHHRDIINSLRPKNREGVSHSSSTIDDDLEIESGPGHTSTRTTISRHKSGGNGGSIGSHRQSRVSGSGAGAYGPADRSHIGPRHLSSHRESYVSSKAPKLDITRWSVNAFRRYCEAYQLPMRPHNSRSQLQEVILRHLRTLNLPTYREIASRFVRKTRNRRMRPRHEEVPPPPPPLEYE